MLPAPKNFTDLDALLDYFVKQHLAAIEAELPHLVAFYEDRIIRVELLQDRLENARRRVDEREARITGL